MIWLELFCVVTGTAMVLDIRRRDRHQQHNRSRHHPTVRSHVRTITKETP